MSTYELWVVIIAGVTAVTGIAAVIVNAVKKGRKAIDMKDSVYIRGNKNKVEKRS